MTSEEQKIIDIQVKYEDAIYGIMRFQEKIEELKSSQKDLNEQLKSGDISLEDYKKQMIATDSAISQYKDNTRVLRKEIQNNLRQEQEQAGSLKQLRAALSNATKAYDELSRAEREGAKGTEMQKNIQNIREELLAAEEATGRFQRNVGSYEDAIKNAIGANSQLGQSLISLTEGSNSVGGVLDNIKDKVSALGSAFKGLLSNPVFLAIGGVAAAGAAFKWFYDYNLGLEKASKLTQQLTGLTGDAMRAVRNDVQATADTFDLDFNETLRAANTLAKAYGISIQDALKQIQDGLVLGADANGQFLDNISEYPRYFQQAGISAEEFVAISVNATKQGIFSDKGLDAIKEADLRLREMTTATASALDGIGISSKKVQEELQNGSKTTFDIMQEVSKKLNELPANSAAVGSAVADIFGGPGEDAGLQYIKTLGDIQLNLEKVKQGAGGVASAQEAQLKAQRELNNAVSALFDITGGGFENMKAQILTIGTQALTKVINGVIDLINYFVELYNESTLFRGVVQTITYAFKLQWNAAKLLFGLLIDGFKSVGNSAKGLVKILEGLVTLNLDKAYEGWNDIISNIGNTFKQGAGRFVQYGRDMANDFADGFNKTINGKINKIKIPALSDKGGVSGTSTSTATNAYVGAADANGGINKKSNKVDEDQQKRILEEQRKAQDLLLSLIADEYAKRREQIKVEYDRQIQDLQTRLKDEKYLTLEEQDAITTQIIALQEKRYKKLDALSNEQMQKDIQAQIDNTNTQLEYAEGNIEREIQLKQQQLEQERELRKLQAQQQITDQEELRQKLLQIDEEYNAKELMLMLQSITQSVAERQKANQIQAQDEQKKWTAIAGMTTAASNLARSFGEENKTLTMLSKTLALASVAINTGVAISKAIAAAAGNPLGFVQIAGIISQVLSAMATATSIIKSAKFAKGGLVTGKGTGTSDSIPARLSNGESVMTAKATSMFSPLLSTFNQLGGGVPITVNTSSASVGEDFLAAAVAKGFMMCPAPVVSVEEISRVQKRVKTIQNISRI